MGSTHVRTHRLTDAFRHLYPCKREYTRRHTTTTNEVTTVLSKSRLDCGLLSRSLLTQAAPALHMLEHIEPSAGQLQTLRDLREAGRTTKKTWSDHAAIQITIRYSDVKQPPPSWRFPNYLLDDREAYDHMRSIIDQGISRDEPDDISRVSTARKALLLSSATARARCSRNLQQKLPEAAHSIVC